MRSGHFAYRVHPQISDRADPLGSPADRSTATPWKKAESGLTERLATDAVALAGWPWGTPASAKIAAATASVELWHLPGWLAAKGPKHAGHRSAKPKWMHLANLREMDRAPGASGGEIERPRRVRCNCRARREARMDALAGVIYPVGGRLRLGTARRYSDRGEHCLMRSQYSFAHAFISEGAMPHRLNPFQR